MLLTFLQSFAGALQARTAYHRTLQDLSRLTDRELQDIGLSRSEIHEVAAGRAVDAALRRSPSPALTARVA